MVGTKELANTPSNFRDIKNVLLPASAMQCADLQLLFKIVSVFVCECERGSTYL